MHATGEAVTNAAKHAGTGKIDVYAEVTDGAVDVFVRDRGRGFDPDAVPEDRYGVRKSIVDRMQRHGGIGRGPVRRPARGPRCGCTCPDRRRAMGEQRPTGPVSIVIVDDHAMFRRGVRAELESAGRGVVDVRAEAADVDEAVAAVSTHHPDVVLLDVHLPGGGGVEVMRQGRRDRRLSRHPLPGALGQRRRRGRHRHHPRRRPRLRHQDHHRPRAGAGDQPGLRGRRGVLAAARRASCSTRSPGSIDVAAVDEDLDRLTEREREVMRLIARGYAYKEVAKELFISIKTVETHMSSVLRKLQLSSRHELTRWASDRRLL